MTKTQMWGKFFLQASNKDKMTVVKKELITITPKKASELLGKNFNNRELHPMNVQYFVDIIECGEWQGTKANSIQIDITGNLINGQHRLNAIVQTNAELPVWIFTVEL